MIEQLDSGVQAIYDAATLTYRPRYTPVVRALTEHGALSLREIAEAAGLSHSAVSQTVSQMRRAGLVGSSPGADGRERIVSATPALLAMLPQLQSAWRATSAAADALDRQLSFPLSALVEETIAALEAEPFATRIARCSPVNSSDRKETER